MGDLLVKASQSFLCDSVFLCLETLPLLVQLGASLTDLVELQEFTKSGWLYEPCLNQKLHISKISQMVCRHIELWETVT